MSDPFVAEIRVFPFSFAPKGWALCNGQLLSISQNTALFSLLSTTYGGDGKSTFALPNLQGMAAMHFGTQGPHVLGESSGSPTETLIASELPAHAHTWNGSDNPAHDRTPGAEYVAQATGGFLYASSPVNVAPLAAAAIAPVGGDQPHNNMQPYLTMSFCIATVGIFPPRS